MGSGRWNESVGVAPEGDKDLKGKIVESLSAASELTSTLLLLQRPFTGRGLFGLGLQTASIVSRLHQIWTRPPNIDVAHAFKDWVVLDSDFQMFALGGLRLIGTIDPDWVSVYRGAIFNAAYHAEVEGVQLGYVSNRSLVEVPHNGQEATAMTAGTSLVPLYCKKLSDLRPLIHKRFWASAPNTGLLRITTGNKREEITLPTTFRETARLQQLVSTARSFVEAKIPWCFLLDGEPGTGKCLAPGTRVLMWDGTQKPVEAIAVGDLLMGPDSKPRLVSDTTSGYGPMFTITPNKGSSWQCNDVHVLTVVDSRTDKIYDIALDKFLRSNKTLRAKAKLFTTPVDFPPATPLPLDPYFVGIWLGDGTKSLDDHGRLALVAITKPDIEIRTACVEIARKFGLTIHNVETRAEACPQYRLTTGNVDGGPNPLLDLLRTLFGGELTVPHTYLTASRTDRAAFLAGVIDTDGHNSCGGVEITQKRRDWADAIAFVARSLGLHVSESNKKVPDHGIYRRLFITGDFSQIPIRIARKRPALRKHRKNVLRTGFTVTPAGNGQYYGFTLEGTDGRFLLGDFTVTHNTTAALHVTHRLGLRAVVLEANHIARLPDSVEDSILYKVTDIIQPDVLIISDIDRLSNEDQLILLELLDYARRWVKLIFLTSNHSERLLDAVERAERIDETFPIGGLEQEEIVALVQMMPEHVRTRISTEFIAQMNGWPIVYVLNLLKRVEAQLTIGPMTDDELNAVFTKVVERRNAAHTKWLEQREHPLENRETIFR